MLLWSILVLITALAIAFLLWPLLARRGPAASRTAYDMAVYRDQLAEVERDHERGLLSVDEFQAARTEISRRILAVADANPHQKGSVSTIPKLSALALACILPIAAFAIYAELGAPELPAFPFAERPSAQPQTAQSEAGELEAQTAKLAERLRRQPEDSDGWALLGRSYLALGRYEESIEAYRQADERSGGSPGIASALGESLVLASRGIVTPEARAVFDRALERAPFEPRSRYYIGLAEAQAGNPQNALRIWRELETQSSPDAPWLPPLRARIAEVAAQLGMPEGATLSAESVPQPSGPTQEDISAAAEMTGDERVAMVRNMVDGLAERLRDEPDDVDGWLMLARSYNVLGEFDSSADAYRRAASLAADDVEVQLAYGEALVVANNDRVTAEARTVFETVLERLPDEPRARYYMGLAAMQGGKHQTALEIWTALEAESPEGAPWLSALRANIRESATTLGIDPESVRPTERKTLPAPTETTGPTADDIAAAREMSEGDRNAMIRRMVAGLAERLAEEPDDLDGWLMLARSYKVLGEQKKSAEAYRHAARLAPDKVSILLDYGEALLTIAEEGEPAPATFVAVMRDILALQPDHPVALWYLGLAEMEAGNREAARELWRRLLERLPPDAPERERVIELLNATRPAQE